MIRSKLHTHVSVLGSTWSVTNTPSDVRNDPVGHWMPPIFDRQPLTESGQDRRTEEEHWADLAASARADWAAENPF